MDHLSSFHQACARTCTRVCMCVVYVCVFVNIHVWMHTYVHMHQPYVFICSLPVHGHVSTLTLHRVSSVNRLFELPAFFCADWLGPLFGTINLGLRDVYMNPTGH